jgi:hypothetical protein
MHDEEEGEGVERVVPTYIVPDFQPSPMFLRYTRILPSVADPGCLSRIPDPKTAMKDRGEK